jgi:hypothetical protein
MYQIQIDYTVYSGYKDGRPFTLVGALREVVGTCNAHILRMDGTPVVRHAGSAYGPILYVPKGKAIYRRRVSK